MPGSAELSALDITSAASTDTTITTRCFEATSAELRTVMPTVGGLLEPLDGDGDVGAGGGGGIGGVGMHVLCCR